MNHIFEILKSIFIDFSLVVYVALHHWPIVQLVVENLFEYFQWARIRACECSVAVRGCNCALIIL